MAFLLIFNITYDKMTNEVKFMGFTNLKNFMDHLTSWRVPGNIVYVFKENKKVFEYCSGYDNVDLKTPMTFDKNFYMYSCTKILTTLCALQLYEKGKFLLTDPLYDYIPEFKNMTYKKDGEILPCKKPITIRDLFTMTSGLNYNMNTEAFDEARKITNGKFDTLETVKCLAKMPLDFEPGERWQYSLSHDVLAAFVEVVSGMKFRDYVAENVLKPTDTYGTFCITEKQKENLASLYWFVSNDGTTKDAISAQSSNTNMSGGYLRETTAVNEFIFGDNYDSGGAGFISTPLDFAKITSAIVNGDLLNKNTVDLWRTSQLSKEQLVNYTWGQLLGYGYGLGVRTLTDKALGGSSGPLGEFGWCGAAGAISIMDIENNLSLFYCQHMLNNQEAYIQPRLRNILYGCL